jgi:hypothetical protein
MFGSRYQVARLEFKAFVLMSGDFLAEHLVAPLINVQFRIIQSDGSGGVLLCTSQKGQQS